MRLYKEKPTKTITTSYGDVTIRFINNRQVYACLGLFPNLHLSLKDGNWELETANPPILEGANPIIKNIIDVITPFINDVTLLKEAQIADINNNLIALEGDLQELQEEIDEKTVKHQQLVSDLNTLGECK